VVEHVAAPLLGRHPEGVPQPLRALSSSRRRTKSGSSCALLCARPQRATARTSRGPRRAAPRAARCHAEQARALCLQDPHHLGALLRPRPPLTLHDMAGVVACPEHLRPTMRSSAVWSGATCSGVVS
jgi:hypothetical protein